MPYKLRYSSRSYSKNRRGKYSWKRQAQFQQKLKNTVLKVSETKLTWQTDGYLKNNPIGVWVIPYDNYSTLRSDAMGYCSFA
jgi:hypothetical protein